MRGAVASAAINGKSQSSLTPTLSPGGFATGGEGAKKPVPCGMPVAVA